MIKTGDSFNQLVTIAVLCYVRIDYKILFAWEKKKPRRNFVCLRSLVVVQVYYIKPKCLVQGITRNFSKRYH